MDQLLVGVLAVLPLTMFQNELPVDSIYWWWWTDRHTGTRTHERVFGSPSRISQLIYFTNFCIIWDPATPFCPAIRSFPSPGVLQPSPHLELIPSSVPQSLYTSSLPFVPAQIVFTKLSSIPSSCFPWLTYFDSLPAPFIICRFCLLDWLISRFGPCLFVNERIGLALQPILSPGHAFGLYLPTLGTLQSHHEYIILFISILFISFFVVVKIGTIWSWMLKTGTF